MTFIRAVFIALLLAIGTVLPAQTFTYTDTEIRDFHRADMKIILTKEGECHFWLVSQNRVLLYRYDEHFRFKDRQRFAFKNAMVSLARTNDGYLIVLSGNEKKAIYQWKKGELDPLQNTPLNEKLRASQASYVQVLLSDSTIFLVQLSIPARNTAGAVEVDFFDHAFKLIKATHASVADINFAYPSFTFNTIGERLFFSYTINLHKQGGIHLLAFDANTDMPKSRLVQRGDLVFMDQTMLVQGGEIFVKATAADSSTKTSDFLNYAVHVDTGLTVKSTELLAKTRYPMYWKTGYRYVPQSFFSLPNKGFMVLDNAYPIKLVVHSKDSTYMRFIELDSNLQLIKSLHFPMVYVEMRALFVTEIAGSLKWFSTDLDKNGKRQLSSFGIENDLSKPDKAYRLMPDVDYLPEYAVQVAPGIIIVPYVKKAGKWGLVKINWNAN